MPLILLGLIVAAGLLAYMYFSGQIKNSQKSKSEEHSSQKETEPSIIYLPADIEGEKQKRNVKTGK